MTGPSLFSIAFGLERLAVWFGILSSAPRPKYDAVHVGSPTVGVKGLVAFLYGMQDPKGLLLELLWIYVSALIMLYRGLPWRKMLTMSPS